PDGRDPAVVPVPLLDSAEVKLDTLRVAYYIDNGVIPVDSELSRVIDQTVDALRQDGLSIKLDPLPDMPRMTELMSELRRSATGAAAKRLLDKFGTKRPGPDLERYFKNSDLSDNAAVKTSLLESIDEQRSRALMFMQNYDALLCPPSHVLARPHGEASQEIYENWSYITLQNLLGWPAGVVRAGSNENGELPVGVQIVAAPWREDIDAIAASGMRFTRHITPMQICSPSRATMLTGLYPRHHGLVMNGMALPQEVPTVTAMLQANGYVTHGVGKQHLQPLLAPAQYAMPDSRAFWGTADAAGWNGPYYGYQTLDLLLGESDTASIAGHYANWLRENHPTTLHLLEPKYAQQAPPEDLDEIWRYGVTKTPALIINGEVKSAGIQPLRVQIEQWIEEAAGK
ncbi:MAG: sulfatase-like hydrolase/transferase, partial [Desulfobulbaceae bacterium]